MIHLNIDIRKHIINNFKGESKKTIENSIEESIKENDELSLPGMGTLFEILWKNADNNLKESILNVIKNNLV